VVVVFPPNRYAMQLKSVADGIYQIHPAELLKYQLKL
jgi:hypothetical protein